MKKFRYVIITLCLVALVAISGLVGGFIGLRMARHQQEKKDDPETWNESSRRKFEHTVKPTPEQWVKLEGYLNQAVEDLKAIRADTIARSTNVVWRLVGQVEKELTPEQLEAFAKMKPNQQDLSTLDLLRVEKK